VAQVNVTINSRQFRMACADGEEDHLRTLARELDERIAALRAQFGEIGDARLTVMAAIMVADELSEAAKKARRLEEELAAVRDGRVAATDRSQAAEDALVEAFVTAAERIEGLAGKLNQTNAGGGAGSMEKR
jgi:cell division protein ZapA